jgi:hypothetical protein
VLLLPRGVRTGSGHCCVTWSFVNAIFANVYPLLLKNTRRTILKGEVDLIMRVDLILVYTMLSVELSIGWLKIRCARMRAHRIFDRCFGAFINKMCRSSRSLLAERPPVTRGSFVGDSWRRFTSPALPHAPGVYWAVHCTVWRALLGRRS